jgi:DNA-binding PadR family transcriptional regulator
MVEAPSGPDSFLPLTPAVFHILLALADGEKHGYAIMLEVEDVTQGTVQMGPGTLYGSIKRMLAAGLIEESDDRPDPTLDDERRRYYRHTGLGRKVLRRETERMAELTALARRKHVLAGIGSRSIPT